MTYYTRGGLEDPDKLYSIVYKTLFIKRLLYLSKSVEHSESLPISFEPVRTVNREVFFLQAVIMNEVL